MFRRVRSLSVLLLGAGLLSLLLLLPGCRGKSTAAGAGARAGGARPRVLVIGLDGADWEIIDRLEAKGRLPNLSRMRREGAWGSLTSENPLISAIVWTTIATGRSPLDHGVFGFLTRRNGVDEPVRSDERQVRAFWNIASDRDVPVGVLGWYATWPAEPVKGFLVSDRAGVHQVPGASERPTAGLAYPPELERDVDAARREAERTVDESTAKEFFAPGADLSLLPQGKMHAFLGVLRTTEMERRLFWPLCERYRPGIAAIYFEGTDSVGHLFVDYAPPGAPGVDPRLMAMYGGAFDEYYSRVDAIVGELIAPLSPQETTVIVVSDHGFRSGADRPNVPMIAEGNQAPEWHRLNGVVLLWGRGVKHGVQLPASRIYDILPTMLRLADLPLARNLAGHPIEAALTPEALSHPVQTVADFEAKGPWVKATPPAPANAAENQEQIERLRALGYIGGAPASEKPAAGGLPEGQMGNPYSVFNRAQLLTDAGRLDEALTADRDLVQRWPDSVLGWYGQGLVLQKLGRFEEAFPPLERAASLAGNNAFVLGLLGEVELQTGRLPDAELHLTRSAQLDPALRRPAFLLASRILNPRGELDRSAALLEPLHAQALPPAEGAGVASELAVIAEKRGQPDQAEKLYREALETAPGYTDALGRLGRLLLSQRRASEALPFIEQFIAKEPQEFRGYTLYGYALAQVGRTQEARAALQRSLSIQPGQGNVRQFLSQLGP